jgi:alkanesulfonate monooxygenase SsuD/methylene tetrahydromethanopterin reductase-like flavin-dependent oxidoreductase (luciferase family)
MNVGIYFDLRNPPERATADEHLYGFTLEMCEEAEHLGCHSIWVSEHHRFDDGYLPQPLTLAAALAARTRTPRIGTAIVIAPLHHAAELAEQAAIVDIISAGRLELGLGAGYRVPEFELYGADPATRYAATDARARELRRLWDEGVVTPGPVQARPPIWLGYQGPKGARRAGRLGEGLLSIDPALVGPYREGLAEGGHDLTQARMAGGIQGWTTEDPEADWPLVARHLAYQVDSYRRHMVEGTDHPTPRAVDADRLRQRDFGGPLSYFLYGTPEEVAARIQGYIGDAPVETVFFWASLGGMPEDLVARNVKTICTRLAPLLAERRDDPAVA